MLKFLKNCFIKEQPRIVQIPVTNLTAYVGSTFKIGRHKYEKIDIFIFIHYVFFLRMQSCRLSCSIRQLATQLGSYVRRAQMLFNKCKWTRHVYRHQHSVYRCRSLFLWSYKLNGTSFCTYRHYRYCTYWK